MATQFGKAAVLQTWGSYVAPLKPGPYIRQFGDVQVGQWGMIAQNNKTSKPQGQTNNARHEDILQRKTYAPSWLAGRRCLIPAEIFTEPYYPPDSVKSISWSFARADGDAWALAGIWSEWLDPATGELVPSYSMLTQNCDAHPLLKLMHKPERYKDGTLKPPEEQDKRAVVPLERDKWDEWLHGSVEKANALVVLPAQEIFKHGAGDPAKNIPLPGEAALGQISSGPAANLFEV